MATALAAGLGVAGVTAAADAQAREVETVAAVRADTQTAAEISALPAGQVAAAATIREGEAETHAAEVTADRPALSFVRVRRKQRPAPKVTPAWVNPMPEGAVTSCFGQRWGRLHAGVDLAAPSGTPIRAVGAGVVISAGPADGYGIAVLIDHGNGYLTLYGHMSAVTVTAGQKVKAGDQIGPEGSTGHSTGPHLHLEVHKGAYKNPIEPTRWMHEHGVAIPGCAAVPDEDETA